VQGQTVQHDKLRQHHWEHPHTGMLAMLWQGSSTGGAAHGQRGSGTQRHSKQMVGWLMVTAAGRNRTAGSMLPETRGHMQH
jgi:hypothetical protein